MIDRGGSEAGPTRAVETAVTRSLAPEPPRRADDAAPQRVGRYALLGLLGSGGMGVVYLARDELLDRRIALKLLDPADSRASTRARLLREAQALARLSHANVVTIFEAGEHEGRVYLAMEWIAGETLRAWQWEQRRTRGTRRGWAERLELAVQAGRGLAAAHDAGLVHRDFKPENVMIGDDGQVRVMDFGLARVVEVALATEEDVDVVAVAGAGAGTSSAPGVTAFGAVVGTPGYMSPEQGRGGVVDASSDIYSYCVVLFELFTGERPPAADAGPAIRVKLDQNNVPRWMAAILERGLRASPAARWPTMHALLGAIEAVLGRRRRLRLAGLTIALVVVATAAVLGALTLRERLWAAEREAHAAARAAAIDAADDPEAAFAAFIADPEHRGTRALVQAWARRGERARARGAVDEALVAHARAYVEASAGDEVEASLRALAAIFAAIWDAPALARATAELRARGAVDDAVNDLAVTAALGLRDPAGALALLEARPRSDGGGWAPVLRALAGGRSLGFAALRFAPLAPGGAVAYAAVDLEGTRLLDRNLATLGRAPGHIVAVPGTRLGVRDGRELVDFAAPEVVVWRPEATIGWMSGLPAAGEAALLFSYPWPRNGLLRVGEPPSGQRAAHPATHRSGAGIDASWLGDLDGDGEAELVVVFTPPADDLRVFRVDAAGEVALIHRLPLPGAAALTAARDGDARLLVVAREPLAAVPASAFRTATPAAPGGYERLRWTGAALVAVDRVDHPAPGPTPPLLLHAPMVAADVDGDGIDEVFHELRLGGRESTAIVHRAGSGPLEVRIVGGIEPLAAVDVDDDPADELVVRVFPDGESWVLGAAGAPLPALHPPAPAPSGRRFADPWLAERARQAEAVAAMGRPREAAVALEDLARLSADPGDRAALHDRSAALWVAAGEDARAIALDARLAADPGVGARALARRAEALLRLGRAAEAHGAAVALADHPARSDAEAALAARLQARLRPLIREAASVAGDDPRWRVVHPLGLRRDREAGSVEASAAGGPDPLLELPLTWSGEALALEAELDVTRLESGACLGVGVQDDTGAIWLGVSVCGGADEQSHLRRSMTCKIGDDPGGSFLDVPTASARLDQRVILRATWFPGVESACTAVVDGRAAAERFHLSAPPPPRGRLRLVFGAFGRFRRPALVAGALRRVAVDGAALDTAPAAADAWDRAARHLLEGDAAAARAVLGDRSGATLREHLVRIAVADRLGDLDGLAAAVDAAAPELLAPAGLPWIALGFRSRPLLAAALLDRLGAALVPVLAEAYAGVVVHLGDRATRQEALGELARVRLGPTGDADVDFDLGALWMFRGFLAAEEGLDDAAIRDLEAGLVLAPGEAEERGDMHSLVHAALARLLADEAPERARVHAAAAIRLSPTPESTRELLAGDPRLGGLLDPSPLAGP